MRSVGALIATGGLRWRRAAGGAGGSEGHAGPVGERLHDGAHLLAGEVYVAADGREVRVPEVLRDESRVAGGLAQPCRGGAQVYLTAAADEHVMSDAQVLGLSRHYPSPMRWRWLD